MSTKAGSRLRILRADVGASSPNLAEVALQGLRAVPKRLPCQYFYDARGSALFEKICALPEYYLTRTERAILEGCAPEILSAFSGPIALVEFGSGSSSKTRLLIEAALDRQDRLEYVPIDISSEFLRESAQDLLERYTRLDITGIAAEYYAGLHAIPRHDRPRLILFLGSNIGNFEPAEATEFLRRIRDELSREDRLLVGADVTKDPAVIEAAYNDSARVTEAFNKNLLVRINRELGGQFDLDSFEHRAPFHPDKSRIEMWLYSRRPQTVWIRALDRAFSFEAGEGILTEYSHKYRPGALEAMASRAGFAIQRRWTDERGWFQACLFRPA